MVIRPGRKTGLGSSPRDGRHTVPRARSLSTARDYPAQYPSRGSGTPPYLITSMILVHRVAGGPWFSNHTRPLGLGPLDRPLTPPEQQPVRDRQPTSTGFHWVQDQTT